ncbi:MAG: nicotinate-nucleotide adenylyltransferase [Hyphomicrobiaceae bacterium]|nr:nicotinate-nucleotide adenylyltransferase [Hyphomicrobiaceae bacterium]
MRAKPPLVLPGQRIGLLGGSFNPPHAAHKLITDIALTRLQLDAVWWIVTPGNPLKSHNDLAPLGERIAMCEAITEKNPNIKITAFEKDLPSAYTAATIAFLKLRFADVRFVWLMGADNLASFHRWEQWRSIAAMMPIAVVDRPNWRLPAVSGHAARVLQRFYVGEACAATLAQTEPPAWTFLTGPLSDLSSTAIRAARRKVAD